MDCVTLSICVVTGSLVRINDFLSAQQAALSHSGVELLVFCSDEMSGNVRARVAGLPMCKVISDGVKSGPNRKRNLLLRLARGKFVAFLDDDSLFVQPKLAIEALLNRVDPSADWLLWTARYRRVHGQYFDVAPRSFTCFGPGSGIEWNQGFRRELLLQAGGWHPDFCTGERWCSGGALKVMIALWSMGIVQTHLSQVVIEHPAQLDANDPASSDKMLRYRYGIGAVVASEHARLGWRGVSAWIARLGLLAPLRGVTDLACGRKASGSLRLATPARALRGAADWVRDQQANGCFAVK